MSISAPNRATAGAGSPQTFAGLPEGLAQRAQEFVRTPGRLLIDGEWVEAVSGKTFETLNPATEEKLGWWRTARPRTSSSPWLRLVGASTTSARPGAG